MRERRIEGVQALGSESEPTLVAIGNFDGVHAGHRAVLGAASRDAHARHLGLTVLTFHPHPVEVLGRGKQLVLTPLARKIELLGRVDPNLRVVVEPFTMDLASLTPRAFAEVLAGPLNAKVVVVGQNFRFGKARAGDLKMLSELGKELGFEARAEALKTDGEGAISSSRIRAAIGAGELALAESFLGRPHALSGTVVHGDGRGRTIGVPTANLAGIAETLPPYGVYACVVDRLDEHGSATRLGTGVANIGTRPTMAAGFSVEAHLHDFDGDLYGSGLRLHLTDFIRPEKKFESLPSLVAQIRTDIETARQATSKRTPDPAAGAAWY